VTCKDKQREGFSPVSPEGDGGGDIEPEAKGRRHVVQRNLADAAFPSPQPRPDARSSAQSDGAKGGFEGTSTAKDE
jgi:hypothetical protein